MSRSDDCAFSRFVSVANGSPLSCGNHSPLSPGSPHPHPMGSHSPAVATCSRSQEVHLGTALVPRSSVSPVTRSDGRASRRPRDCPLRLPQP